MAIGGGMAPPFPVRVIEVAANYGSVLPNVSRKAIGAAGTVVQSCCYDLQRKVAVANQTSDH
jgi:hypothetical protein